MGPHEDLGGSGTSGAQLFTMSRTLKTLPSASARKRLWLMSGICSRP